MISQAEIASKFPDPLKSKFDNEGRRSLLAAASAQRFQKWFDHSGLPFFPDYTDHSFDHSMAVLQTAVDMASRDAFDVLTGTDLALLVSACCCHDAGMHLTETQFQRLIAIDASAFRSKIDEKPWPALWDDYFSEATRFSDRQLMAIFGDDKPVRAIPDDVIEYSKRDKLLIGEFIRRHHPRLAHEIANGLDEELGIERSLAGFDRSESDLVGLIARSHGMSLRDALPYVEDQFDLRDFQGCHAVYLMALLRLSDYAQIQSARAPLIHDQLHTRKSPISAREWRVHQSISNINNTHSDPEAIFIDARPKSVKDLSRVREWLNGLQAEIDVAWAVLGEVYGRHKSPPLDQLQLNIRRIRSNALDTRSSKFDFVPEALSFKVAEAEMLSLLLAPLYGDHPMYGIRELVQNAKDAALEAGADTASNARPPRVSVHISTVTTPPSVTVQDNGVGMSLDVIRNYFLNAGASYRRSEEWRKTFETADGRSKVSRTGRFGVGALAAFLLGDVVEVTTRQAGAPDGLGYHFRCQLQDQEIEVTRVPCEIGTTIRIESTNNIIADLRTEAQIFQRLFHFDDVDLVIAIEHAGKETLEIYCKKPKYDDGDFIQFSTSEIPYVQVNIGGKDYLYDDVRTFVNGIAIAALRSGTLSFASDLYQIRDLTDPLALPSGYRRNGIQCEANLAIYATDPDARIALNLSRTGITKSNPEITDEIDRYFLSSTVKLMEQAIPRWRSGDLDLAELGRVSAEPEQLLFIDGSCYLNDMSVVESSGALTYCRSAAGIDELIELSRRFREVIFQYGQPPHGKTEFVHYFRDMDRALAGTGCSIISLDAEKTEELLSGPNVPKWLTEIALEADSEIRGSNRYKLFHFGGLTDDNFETAAKIRSSITSGSVEYFRSTDYDLQKWSRWSWDFRRTKSPFERLAGSNPLEVLKISLG